MALQHLRCGSLSQFLMGESCQILTQGALGSRVPPVIDRLVSCILPTVLRVQRKVVSNILFKNRLRRKLRKFDFLTKIIKVSNICYFWRIFRNIHQNANWPVKVFVIISWSKVKLLTRLYLGISYLRWAQVQT